MDLKKTMNTDFLGSWDFKKDEKKILTIKQVVQREVYNPNTRRNENTTVMEFTNHPCALILNATNKKMLIKLFQSSITEDYHGKNIALITKNILVRKEEMEAVRIDNTLPTQPAALKPAKKELFNELHKGWDAACEAIKTGKVTIEQIKSKYELAPETVEKLKTYETV